MTTVSAFNEEDKLKHVIILSLQNKHYGINKLLKMLPLDGCKDGSWGSLGSVNKLIQDLCLRSQPDGCRPRTARKLTVNDREVQVGVEVHLSCIFRVYIVNNWTVSMLAQLS